MCYAHVFPCITPSREEVVCIVLNTVLLPAAVRWCGTARSVRENQYSTLYDRQGRLGLLQALAHTPSVDVTVTIIVISYSVIPLCIYQFCVSICVLLCHVCAYPLRVHVCCNFVLCHGRICVLAPYRVCCTQTFHLSLVFLFVG